MNLGIEDEYTEFKRSTSELKEGVASIAAMLNKHRRALLYFGVRNDGEVVGQDVAETTLRQVSQAVISSIEPPVYPAVTRMEDDEGNAYVCVSAFGDDRPYACQGRYRVRVADENVLMSPAEVRRMVRERDYELEPWDTRPSRKTLADVNEDVLKAYVERGIACGRIVEPYTNVRDVLERLGLLRGDVPTNAADVLFCRQNTIGLKMGIVATHARTEILDLHQEEGTIFELVDQAAHYILVNTRRRLIIEGGGPREEIPEIPPQAVREALFNAYAHQAWQNGYGVIVDIYHDAVEILNAGWFIEGQDPEEHLTARSTSSQTRNALIAKTLYRSKDNEGYGTGIPRMKALCDAKGVGVEYRRTSDGTKIVFHRRDAFEEFAAHASTAGRQLANADDLATSADEIPPNSAENPSQAGRQVAVSGDLAESIADKLADKPELAAALADKLADKPELAAALADKLADKPELAATLAELIPLTSSELYTLLILLDGGEIKAAQVSQTLDIPARTARYILSQLIDKKVVVSRGANRNRTYRLRGPADGDA